MNATASAAPTGTSAPGRPGPPDANPPAAPRGSQLTDLAEQLSNLPDRLPDLPADLPDRLADLPDQFRRSGRNLGSGRDTVGDSAGAPAGSATDPGNEQTRLLMRLMVAGQERERRHLCDAFHDGPIQDLTAVLLTCSAVRRSLSGPAAEQLAALESQLRDTITSLRLPPPAFRAGSDARKILETALAGRVRGPLAHTLDTVLDVDDPEPDRGQIAELLGAVQLLLQEGDPLRPAAHAQVTIRSGKDGVALTLRVTPDPLSTAASPDAGQHARARTERLSRIAALTGTQVVEDRPGGLWSASLAWPHPDPAGTPPGFHPRVEHRPGLAVVHALANDR
ncbi:hypothetical protein I6A84_38295 [Frankia sp. CNm7]|uniref:Histidine kinase n=1 Tax=Frankia nepalensis TaxID=1836974 RepID=A0A937RAW6_9ACTN|nr:histidine kinase [Frankia nepalensis]MBL7497724.1 hypothetical protein [Frankia nepalensis]MBL7514166.1 hypothetical protein [Frankia nepalensis]MBL7523738.1 hypothetical protein [Frankia nepalensis]MBL7625645.1 hypothetical protein [Frankia nepalensis]